MIYLASDPIPEWAIVDSGSTHSLLPPHVADRVGLTYDRSQQAPGGGIRPFIYNLASGTLSAKTEFGEAFVLDKIVVSTYPGFALLGRHDFFEAFFVAFDHRNRQFQIDRQPPRMGFQARRN
jgi:hypothetical protein